MSSLINRTREVKPMRRIRSRVVAGVAATAMSAAAVVAIAAPAQARPRSCANIMQSMMFFALAIQMDTGESAQYLAQDTRMFNYNVRLFHGAGC
jgi:putative Ca2+/H+ antiporter (TMEM165/GDT1 family)